MGGDVLRMSCGCPWETRPPPLSSLPLRICTTPLDEASGVVMPVVQVHLAVVVPVYETRPDNGVEEGLGVTLPLGAESNRRRR